MSARRSDWQSWMPNCCATAADRNQALQPAPAHRALLELRTPTIPTGLASNPMRAAPAVIHAHQPSRRVLARLPSRDPERHGCRAGAYMDVLAACPAMVGGQGPRSKLAAPKARRPHRIRQCADCLLEALHIAPLDGSSPAHRRGTLSGMDAAPEPTRTYLRRVPRWWAGKGRAANSQRRGRGALTAPDSALIVLLEALHIDPLDGSLPARRRGTLSGMDAAPEPTWTYLRRVPRW
ncbi:hypothetical protein FHT16_000490 [Xanthomonas arboricola]